MRRSVGLRLSLALPLVTSAVVGCAEGASTAIELTAIGLPGATVADGLGTTTIAADGTTRFVTRRLSTRTSLSGTEVIDAETEEPFSLTFARDGEEVSLYPFCFPPSGPGTPVDRVTLLLRRDLTTGACTLIAVETAQGNATFRGEYTPERFDDRPCGPWQ